MSITQVHPRPAADAAHRSDELYEFDREPVSRSKVLGATYFMGTFAGEHVAATEFVIGVLFVNWGASLTDVVVGLAIGNILAILTWALVCSPIAVDTRLTLYWYLRQIGGPRFTLFYNIANALMFCVIAGCMITVSASAVRIPFGIAPQVQWYPTSASFIVLILVVGAAVVAVAILGFKKLASFSTVCSPWMFLMFISGALVMIPILSQAAGIDRIQNGSDLAEVARTTVWTGRAPDGSEPLGLGKIIAFAWICNFAMHAGLSDMALLRYAAKASYGYLTAFGVFLGHYVGWMCAGLMGAGVALLVRQPLQALDSGEVAYQALGWAGVLAVLAAGLTTANPTLYRAGLALQAITPNWSRARVTLVAGAATTILACFPFVFTRLLDVIGIYGLLLSPPGAIVLAEHWILPRWGLNPYWVRDQQLQTNWPAAISWATGVVLATILLKTGLVHLFYLAIPTYLFTMAMYLALVVWSGVAKNESKTGLVERVSSPRDNADVPATAVTVKPASFGEVLLGALAVAALVACVALGIAVATGAVSHPSARDWMIVPTAVYFVAGTLFYRLRENRYGLPPDHRDRSRLQGRNSPGFHQIRCSRR